MCISALTYFVVTVFRRYAEYGKWYYCQLLKHGPGVFYMKFDKEKNSILSQVYIILEILYTMRTVLCQCNNNVIIIL